VSVVTGGVDRPSEGAMPPAGRFGRLTDAWRDQRNRWLMDPRFQRFAARFPLTRPIANRKARALFDVCAGFVYSQVLLASVRLDLFETLRQGPRSVADLARRVSLPEEAMQRLLNAGAALDLFERRGAAKGAEAMFGLGGQGAALLGNPGIAAMVEHHAMLYADLSDPVDMLRRGPGGGRLQAFWTYAGQDRPGEADPAATAAYTRLMAASQGFVADDVVASYPFARHRVALDVGGGAGAFLSRVAAAAPGLHLMLFDLPPVAEVAKQAFAQAGLQARAKTFAGNFHTDPLPIGADIVTLVRVLHDHDDAAALALLKAVRRALPPGGTLLIAEPMAETPGAETMGDAYFGIYLFAMGSGRPRTAENLAALLQQADFREIRQRRTPRPLIVGLIEAR
jgi:demethylspheroidene O-methyltransferase